MILTCQGESVANIGWTQVLFRDELDGTRACYLHVEPASGSVFLRDDTEPLWAGVGTLATAGTISNSQCTLDTGASTAVVSGTNLTLTLALSFKPAFAGDQIIFMQADSAGVNSGWQTVGLWTVPVPPGSLPAGWLTTSIGTTGSASYFAGTVRSAPRSLRHFAHAPRPKMDALSVTAKRALGRHPRRDRPPIRQTSRDRRQHEVVERGQIAAPSGHHQEAPYAAGSGPTVSLRSGIAESGCRQLHSIRVHPR